MIWPVPVVEPKIAATVAVGTAFATAVLIWLLKPWLVRYALARPNARSSHTVPTPQGGGIAIIAAIFTVVVSSVLHGNPAFQASWVWYLLSGLAVLALVGAVDDIRPLPVLPRLGAQFLIAGLLVATVPGDGRIVPFAPAYLELALLTIGLVWLVNLTNFMDGIDWMMVVEVAPIAVVLAALGLFGLVPELTAVLPISLALAGAMIGFAPANKHVAKLFMGDVGSLPIGALVGWLLIILAKAGHWQAAVILPAYFVADATITLVRRWFAGENIAQAHRRHFYQRAVDGGLTAPQVTTRVLALNIVLGCLAAGTVMTSDIATKFALLAAAGITTLGVLLSFEAKSKS